MKTKLFLLAIIFGLAQNYAQQNDTIPKSYGYHSEPFFGPYFKRVTFRIGGGLSLSQGKLEKFLGNVPLVELSLDFPVTDKKSLEFAIQLAVPDQKESFRYVRITDTVETKATFLFNPMLRFKKNFSNSENNKLTLGLGLGASIITTDARNTDFFDTSEDRNKYEVITAFLVSPSIDYSKTFKNNNEFTFSIGLNYSPYKVEGAIQEDIGSIALTPRILYSF